MLDGRALVHMVDKNRQAVVKARKILDGAAGLALLGAGTDPVARGMVVTGTFGCLAGAMVLGGTLATGIAGPVILGMAVIPTAAKLSILAGAVTMGTGFVRGFKEGIRLTAAREHSISKLTNILEQSGDAIEKEKIVEFVRCLTT